MKLLLVVIAIACFACVTAAPKAKRKGGRSSGSGSYSGSMEEGGDYGLHKPNVLELVLHDAPVEAHDFVYRQYCGQYVEPTRYQAVIDFIDFMNAEHGDKKKRHMGDDDEVYWHIQEILLNLAERIFNTLSPEGQGALLETYCTIAEEVEKMEKFALSEKPLRLIIETMSEEMGLEVVGGYCQDLTEMLEYFMYEMDEMTGLRRKRQAYDLAELTDEDKIRGIILTLLHVDELIHGELINDFCGAPTGSTETPSSTAGTSPAGIPDKKALLARLYKALGSYQKK